eukprot:GHRQ01020521.1.p1 GENE.GHRQ01020521.1~~GHRQ01020521.1.p1  ORF type:complete len:237 (+),score=70.50 GHRQ01020521.1:1403-2113(+)
MGWCSLRQGRMLNWILEGLEGMALCSRHENTAVVHVQELACASAVYCWWNRCCCCLVCYACRPGPMLPGLWVSAVSRMGRLVVSCKQQLEAAGDPRAGQLTIPPVFNGCSCILTEQDQQAARDLYWRVVSDLQLQGPQHAQQAVEGLQHVITLNPWVPEPHLMLAQLHIHAKEWGAAREAAATALKLFVQWGTAWDKRMPWDAWVAWSRVCYEAAVDESWPQLPLGVLSMGMVRAL